ncbi:MAG: dUTP diphosphatase [Paraclostridium sp.]
MKHLQVLQNNVELIYLKRLDKLNISNEELLLSKIVLLDTELGEYMNEIEAHKLYKLNKKDNRTRELEELCDCVHVVCSISNMLGIEMQSLEEYIQLDTDNIMITYKKVKKSINSIDIDRALREKAYIEKIISCILSDILAIAKFREVSKSDLLTAFVAVYTKNMIRAKGNY